MLFQAAMPERLSDKVALISGAGSSGPGWGNGKAISVLFAREGANVFAVDINADAAAETASVIASESGACATFTADVSQGEQVAAMVAACLEQHGRIDVLVNVVGIARRGGVVDTPEEVWDQVAAVNLKSVYLTCKHVLPVMEEQASGSIVNLSSIAAHRWTGVAYASYYATKGAVIPLSRSIALEYAGRGIRCNTVSPGLMNTPMVTEGLTGAYGEEGDVRNLVAARSAQCPTGEMGDAWDVAYAALYLASDEAKYVTAHDLVVDGGITAKMS
ncbi:MAG: SDR family NAD(P)-dependent oxidoreductase [Gaiellaceae bacterium]